MSQINQMDLSARKKIIKYKRTLHKQQKWVDRVKDSFNWHAFQFFPIKKATCDIKASVK